MVPMSKAYMLNYEDKFTRELYNEVVSKGLSRIPIYKNNINHLFGIFRVKKMLGLVIDFSIERTLRETMGELKIKVSKPLIVNPDTSLIDLLRMFKKGKSHMAFVTENHTEFKNLIGLDDNNSEIMGGERASGNFAKAEEPVDVLGK